MTEKIAFRMDDICDTMDWNGFCLVRDIFLKYSVKPLLGIVPDNQDPKLMAGSQVEKFYEEMKALEAKGWILSQHGYVHIYDSKDGGILKGRPLSEFAGHSYEVQLERLKSGQDILRENGINPEVFMAPGHTFDENTVKALKELGFKYITDGNTDECYIRDGMKYIPCRSASFKVRGGVDTICIHANECTRDDILELETFIKGHRNVIVGFDELMKLDFRMWGVCLKFQELKNRSLNSLRKFVAGNGLLHGLLVLRGRLTGK